MKEDNDVQNRFVDFKNSTTSLGGAKNSPFVGNINTNSSNRILKLPISNS